MSVLPALRFRLLVGSSQELSACLAVRRRVFIAEQSVPEDLEIDGLDEGCLHVLAEQDGPDGWSPVGTARLRVCGDGTAKAERVAVDAAVRGQGVGWRVMRLLEDRAWSDGHTAVVLGAQLSAMPFYEKLGYSAYGPEFMDAGIPHRMMRLSRPKA